jgi:hypothetical protein
VREIEIKVSTVWLLHLIYGVSHHVIISYNTIQNLKHVKADRDSVFRHRV